MARALLRQQKILILDEATASIDAKTDAEISKVVHEQFQGVTVMIIAHRLKVSVLCLQKAVSHELIYTDMPTQSFLLLHTVEGEEIANTADNHAMQQNSCDGQRVCSPARLASRIDWPRGGQVSGFVQGSWRRGVSAFGAACAATR